MYTAARIEQSCWLEEELKEALEELLQHHISFLCFPLGKPGSVH